MAALPQPTHSTIRRIYRLHEEKREAEEARGYLGASELGEPCARRLWYGFRWCGQGEGFDGRMLRLFDSGNREETRLLQELVDLGYRVEGRQHEVSFADGHGGGHMDAAVLGLEEAPKSWHVADVKTAKASKYAAIVKNGAASVYPKYGAQLQLYMGLTGIERGAFFVVCKDTDEIHLERVKFDQAEFDRLLAKALKIVHAAEPPVRLSEDPAWHECRYCPYSITCHGTAVPSVSCRSCAHVTPAPGGEWRCARYDEAAIPLDVQRVACEEHRFIPVLLERVAELVSADDDNNVRWRNTLTSKTFNQPQYSSHELHAAADFRVIGDDFMQELKSVFGDGSRVVGSRPVDVGACEIRSDLKAVYGEKIVEAWEAGRE